MTGTTPAQDRHAAALNSEFFKDNDRYLQSISGLETYRRIREAIDAHVSGVRRLLDIGNGGVFDYDTSLVGEVVGVDLFLDDVELAVPDNVTLRRGDALHLEEAPGSFDAVLMAFLLHHLVGVDLASTLANVEQALGEAREVLEPGGSVLVFESCVPEWFLRVERAMFPALRFAASRAAMEHPPTMQLTTELLVGAMCRSGFAVTHLERIPTGPTLLQFGHKWPTAFTPARPVVAVGTRA
jgi:SAM-dependent methyltransferase